MIPIRSSEITPEWLYLSRREFMRGLGAVAAGTAVAGCGPRGGPPGSATIGHEAGPEDTMPPMTPAGATEAAPGAIGATTDELGDALTPFHDVTHYNNYYEFSSNKEAVAPLAVGFQTAPWTVDVGGLVHKPTRFGLEQLLQFDQEERVYRLRCVEGWSMVIPWLGFPLHKLLAVVEPKADARFVRMQTVLAPDEMPGQGGSVFEWPYVEGLRIDEAMNDLTILATGLYGRSLLPQNGAPVRLVVPWKYGFKSVKAIVKIDLVADQPSTFWMEAAPNEYGFYANVNPEVPHPRWSQANERRIGEFRRRETLMFNGYADEVAALYAGMDLKSQF
jgi:sulfoxide reductase catalytic subunit YedY